MNRFFYPILFMLSACTVHIDQDFPALEEINLDLDETSTPIESAQQLIKVPF